MRYTENKRELLPFLNKQVITIPTTKKIISTLHNHIHVVYNQPDNTEGLVPCSLNEADTHMMVHDGSFCNKLLSVAMLAAFVCRQLISPLAALWIAFGTGKHFMLLPVHYIFVKLGQKHVLHCLCSMPLQAVIRYSVLLERENEVHGRLGK